MKKFLSIILAAIMLAASAVTASAMEPVSPEVKVGTRFGNFYSEFLNDGANIKYMDVKQMYISLDDEWDYFLITFRTSDRELKDFYRELPNGYYEASTYTNPSAFESGIAVFVGDPSQEKYNDFFYSLSEIARRDTLAMDVVCKILGKDRAGKTQDAGERVFEAKPQALADKAKERFCEFFEENVTNDSLKTVEAKSLDIVSMDPEWDFYLITFTTENAENNPSINTHSYYYSGDVYYEYGNSSNPPINFVKYSYEDDGIQHDDRADLSVESGIALYVGDPNEDNRYQSIFSLSDISEQSVSWMYAKHMDLISKAIGTDRVGLMGDADGDGALTISDATMIQKHLAQLETLSGARLVAANIYPDKDVNINDATQIQKKLAQLIK